MVADRQMSSDAQNHLSLPLACICSRVCCGCNTVAAYSMIPCMHLCMCQLPLPVSSGPSLVTCLSGKRVDFTRRQKRAMLHLAGYALRTELLVQCQGPPPHK